MQRKFEEGGHPAVACVTSSIDSPTAVCKKLCDRTLQSRYGTRLQSNGPVGIVHSRSLPKSGWLPTFPMLGIAFLAALHGKLWWTMGDDGYQLLLLMYILFMFWSLLYPTKFIYDRLCLFTHTELYQSLFISWWGRRFWLNHPQIGPIGQSYQVNKENISPKPLLMLDGSHRWPYWGVGLLYPVPLAVHIPSPINVRSM